MQKSASETGIELISMDDEDLAGMRSPVRSLSNGDGDAGGGGGSRSSSDDDDDGDGALDQHGDPTAADAEAAMLTRQRSTPDRFSTDTSSKRMRRRRHRAPSVFTRIACCCCFLGCCYRDPDRREHCTSRWCFHARQAAFDFFVNLLLFLFCAGAFVAYTVFLSRATEQGTSLLRFVNATYVKEAFVGAEADGLAFQLRVWAVNQIVSRTATVSLLAIAFCFAVVNLVRRVMLCPETRQVGVVISSAVLLAAIAAAVILVFYEQAESRERLLQKTDVLARQIDEYNEWMNLVGSGAPAPSPSGPPRAEQAPTTTPVAQDDGGGSRASDALRTAAGEFVDSLLYKLPESVRVYGLFVFISIVSFINIFR